MNIANIFKGKRKWYYLVGALILFFIVYIARGSSKPPEYSSATVARENLIQSVRETGSIVADNTVTYGWETNGRVIEVLHQVGNEVKLNDVLAKLGATDQSHKYQQAQASLMSSEGALNLKLAGPSDEDKSKANATVQKAAASLSQAEADLARIRSVQQSAVSDAENALQTATNNLQQALTEGTSKITQHAYENLLDTMKTTVLKINDTLKAVDDILGVDDTHTADAYRSNLSVNNSAYLISAENSYTDIKSQKRTVVDPIFTLLSTDHDNIDKSAAALKIIVQKLQALINSTQTVIDNAPAITSSQIGQVKLDSLKAAAANINTAAAGLTSAMQDIDTAKNTLHGYQIAYDKEKLDLDQTRTQAIAAIKSSESTVNIYRAALAEAQASYDSLISTPRDVDIASLRAAVLRDRAVLGSASDEYNKTILKAQADGTISKFDAKVGQTITANAPIITLNSKQLRIDVDISESDIAKLHVDNPVTVTLDAFGEDVKFTGKVFSIEPAETQISGVVYYKTKILLDQITGYDVKSGMTANVQIVTATKDSILTIPQRAILEKDGKKIVRVITDKKKVTFTEREVQTGLKGDEGKIEITSGLNEGEEIITFLKV